MKQNYFDFIICGAGASGLLLLKAIREDSFFNEKSILIIEKEIRNVNDRTWSYWESPNGSFDSILSKKWSKANFCSEDFDSDFDLNPYQYKMLRSAPFYQSIRNKYSKLKIKRAPKPKPIDAGITLMKPSPGLISIPGANKLQKLAATITPPVNPKSPSRRARFISLTKKTNDAPRAVSPQVNRVA